MKATLSLPLDRTAALFVDLQEEHRCDQRFLCHAFDAVLDNARRILLAARTAGVPVRHFAYVVDVGAGTARPFHPVTPDGRSAFSDKDDPLTALCPEVAPAEGEPLILKSEASGFDDGLAAGLKAGGIEWLVVAGVWTEACVDATVKDAMRRGFRVLLVKDACGSGTPAMHQTGILNLANRLYGGAVARTDAACAMLEGKRAEVWMPDGAVPLRYSFETAAALYDAL